MRDQIRQIQWYEGMILEPQHFQQFARYTHLKSLAYSTLLSPFFWGAAKIVINESAVLSGSFLIEELLAIMPDGSLLQVTDDENEKPQINLSEQKNVDWSQPQPIHLCIVKHKDDAANMYSDFPRYMSVEDKDFLDENTGLSPVSIPRLKYKITLISGKKIPFRYVSFPIAYVQYRDDGYVITPFSCATQRITKNTLLYNEVVKTVDEIRRKLNFLSSKVQTSAIDDTNIVFQTLIRYSTILSPLIPRLEVMLESQASHPFDIYKEICFIAGSLANLKQDQVCPKLPNYDHANPLPIFKEVLSYIQNYLSVIRRFSTEIPFIFDQTSSSYTLSIKEEWQWKNQWILSIYSPVDQDMKAATTWAETAIIVSKEGLDKAREARILGAERTVTTSIPELALPTRPNILYLTVTQNSLFIDPNSTIAIYNAPPKKQGDFIPQAITLQAITSEENTTSPLNADSVSSFPNTNNSQTNDET